MQRKGYPSEVRDEEWALVVSYLTVMTEEAPQRQYSLRELFNGVRWVVRTGAAWRRMPQDLPPWSAGYQPRPRWRQAQVCAASVEIYGRCYGSRKGASSRRLPRFWTVARGTRVPRGGLGLLH